MDLPDVKTLVLAGGASKCINTVGALHFFQEKLQNVKKYIGTSAGAIICYLLAIGYSPIEIHMFLCHSTLLKEFENMNLVSIIDKKGLINFNIITTHLINLTLKKRDKVPTIGELFDEGKQMVFVTYNMTKNKPVYISALNHPAMSCLDAIRMTANVPILFDRYFLDGEEYLDGGFVDNFPICQAEDSPNTLGIDISSQSSSATPQTQLGYILKVIMTPYYFFIDSRKKHIYSNVIVCKTSTQAFNFKLSKSEIIKMFLDGYKSAFFHFTKLKKE